MQLLKRYRLPAWYTRYRLSHVALVFATLVGITPAQVRADAVTQATLLNPQPNDKIANLSAPMYSLNGTAHGADQVEIHVYRTSATPAAGNFVETVKAVVRNGVWKADWTPAVNAGEAASATVDRYLVVVPLKRSSTSGSVNAPVYGKFVNYAVSGLAGASINTNDGTTTAGFPEIGGTAVGSVHVTLIRDIANYPFGAINLRLPYDSAGVYFNLRDTTRIPNTAPVQVRIQSNGIAYTALDILQPGGAPNNIATNTNSIDATNLNNENSAQSLPQTTPLANVNSLADGGYTFGLKFTYPGNPVITYFRSFILANTLPLVTANAASKDEIRKTTGGLKRYVRIKGTASDKNGVAEVKIVLRRIKDETGTAVSEDATVRKATLEYGTDPGNDVAYSLDLETTGIASPVAVLGGTYTARVIITDNAGIETVDDTLSTTPFFVDRTAPTITGGLLNVTPTTVTISNRTLTVTGTVSDTHDATGNLTYRVYLDYTPASGDPLTAFDDPHVFEGTGNINTTFDVSNLAAGSHTVSVVVRDSAGNISSVATSPSFTVDQIAPVITSVTSPVANTILGDSTLDTTHTANYILKGVLTDNPTPDTDTITVYRDTIGTPLLIMTGLQFNGAGVALDTHSDPGFTTGTHTLIIRATDVAGNVSTVANRTIIIDKTSPVVTLLTPTAGASVQPGGTVLQGSYSDASPVTATFTITEVVTSGMARSVSVPVTVSGSAITATMPSKFSDNTDIPNNIPVTITLTVTDDKGNPSGTANVNAVTAQLGATTNPVAITTLKFIDPTTSLETVITADTDTKYYLRGNVNVYGTTALANLTYWTLTAVTGGTASPISSGTGKYNTETLLTPPPTLNGVAANVVTPPITAISPTTTPFNTTTLGNVPYTLTLNYTDNSVPAVTKSVTQAIVVDNQPPIVSITSPAGSTYFKGSTTITASIVETNLKEVIFYATRTKDGAGTVISSPARVQLSTAGNTSCSFVFTPAQDGEYKLEVKVIDKALNETTSAPITTTIINATHTLADTLTADTADVPNSLLTPDGTDLFVRGAVTIALTATPSIATSLIQSVTYSVNNVLFSPNGYTGLTGVWNSKQFPDGSYRLDYVLTDKAGSKFSTFRNIKVDNTAPVVSITAPQDAANVSGAVPVAISLVEPNVKEIVYLAKQVKDASGNPIASPVDKQYSPAGYTATTGTWGTQNGQFTDGTYELTVKVTDKAGNVTTSPKVTVSIINVPNTVMGLTVVSVTPKAAQAPANVTNYVSGNVKISAMTSMTSFEVKQIDILVNGTLLTTLPPSSVDSNKNFSYTWDTVAANFNASAKISVVVTNTSGKASDAVPGDNVKSVTVDNIAPTAVFNTPASGSYVKGTIPVTATITETNLDTWKLYDGVTTGTPLASGTTNAVSYNWATSPTNDGAHTLTLVVTDKAGNTLASPVSLAFTVVNTTHTLADLLTAGDTLSAVTLDRDGKYYVRGNANIALTVNPAIDPNLIQSVTYSANGNLFSPGGFKALNGNWNTKSFPDGPYRLDYVLTDKALTPFSLQHGNIVVDNTSPVVGIVSPADSGNPNNPTAIEKTYLVKVFVNEVNPTTDKAGNPYATLSIYNTSDGKTRSGFVTGNIGALIKDGVATYSLDTIRLNNGTYILVANVTDKAGNPAETQVAFRVSNVTANSNVARTVLYLTSPLAVMDENGGSVDKNGDVAFTLSSVIDPVTNLPFATPIPFSTTYYSYATDETWKTVTEAQIHRLPQRVYTKENFSVEGKAINFNQWTLIHSLLTDKVSVVSVSDTILFKDKKSDIVDPAQYSAQGRHLFSFVAFDAAGNSQIPSTLDVTLDINAPVVTVSSPSSPLASKPNPVPPGSLLSLFFTVQNKQDGFDANNIAPLFPLYGEKQVQDPQYPMDKNKKITVLSPYNIPDVGTDLGLAKSHTVTITDITDKANPTDVANPNLLQAFTKPDNSKLDGSVTVTGDLKTTATFNWQIRLLPDQFLVGHTYRVTISGIKDVAGNTAAPVFAYFTVAVN